MQEPDGTKTEYRVWNPFRSKLAAAVLGGVENLHVAPGLKVLYLGAASGTSVSHVSDIVGPTGLVYAVEFSHRSGRDLINMAKCVSLSRPRARAFEHDLRFVKPPFCAHAHPHHSAPPTLQNATEYYPHH